MPWLPLSHQQDLEWTWYNKRTCLFRGVEFQVHGQSLYREIVGGQKGIAIGYFHMSWMHSYTSCIRVAWSSTTKVNPSWNALGLSGESFFDLPSNFRHRLSREAYFASSRAIYLWLWHWCSQSCTGGEWGGEMWDSLVTCQNYHFGKYVGWSCLFVCLYGNFTKSQERLSQSSPTLVTSKH